MFKKITFHATTTEPIWLMFVAILYGLSNRLLFFQKNSRFTRDLEQTEVRGGEGDGPLVT